MSRFDEDMREFARQLRYAADCIDYYQRTSSYNDCNNCGKTMYCEHLPKVGEQTRINCPLWAERKEE